LHDPLEENICICDVFKVVQVFMAAELCSLISLVEASV